jgi:hypothetical protein
MTKEEIEGTSTSEQRVCLILSDHDDPHVKWVLQHIDKYQNCSYLWLDTAEALSDFRINIALENDWVGSVNGYQLHQITSIWYRRPVKPKGRTTKLNEKFVSLAEEEMREVLHNFYRIANCKILPHPKFNNEADYKLLQLIKAKNLGFRVPATLVSNSENWTERLPRGIDYFTVKSIAAYHWFDDDGSEYSLKSSKVHVDDLLKYSSDFSLCPTLIQEYIEKKYEWRITVVEDRIFSCRLNSQIVDGAKDDWRMVEVSEIPHEILEIEPDLQQKIMSYLQEFNLHFGAFDFIETNSGEFVFLECNPNGQWLWIELITQAKISSAIADYLFRK